MSHRSLAVAARILRMTRKDTLRTVKGMRDILPGESVLWEHIEQVARDLFTRYGYDEIRTPLVEPTDLFVRGVGADTDIVTKEMYTWQDRDQSSLTLRPEATASVIRAYIEHRMWEGRPLIKVYYMGPMFRRERTQKGRYRQFYQIGVEAIGYDSVSLDVEVIRVAVQLLDKLQVKGFSLLLNSVGCEECRPKYVALLREEVKKVRDQLCQDCQRRSETNPLRVLDCKIPADQAIINRLPTITSSLCFACNIHFERVKQYLNDHHITYAVQPRLVRGLDYYTRTTFEIVHGELGAQNSLLGGGRYDGLSEELGGPHAPGVGFALGEDRFALVVPRPIGKPLLHISWLEESARKHASELQEELHREGIMATVYPEALKPKRFLEIASRLSARHDVYGLIVGDREVNEGKYQLRDITHGTLLQPKSREELRQLLKEKARQAE